MVFENNLWLNLEEKETKNKNEDRVIIIYFQKCDLILAPDSQLHNTLGYVTAKSSMSKTARMAVKYAQCACVCNAWEERCRGRIFINIKFILQSLAI